MAVPKLDELHRPVLEIANASTQRLARKEFVERLTDMFSLTDADLQEMVPSGWQTRMENRTGWAITDLKKAGLINNPQRNQWEITQTGRDFLASQQGIIKFSDLQKLWLESQQNQGVPTTDTSDSVDITPDEQMAKSHEQHQTMLSDEVLDSVKSVTPSGFEQLVVGLLSKMGYGYGKPVGGSGDQGIDGILNQDTLGLEKSIPSGQAVHVQPGGGTGNPQLSRQLGYERRDQRRVYNHFHFQPDGPTDCQNHLVWKSVHPFNRRTRTG